MGKHVFGSLDPNSPKSANIQSLPVKYNSFRVPANAEHIIISNTSKLARTSPQVPIRFLIGKTA